MQTLRQTLEHVDDIEWLNKRSPLASVFFAGISTDPARRRQVVLTGLKEIDERLRATWHQWEARSKSPLQSAIWEAVCHLPPDLESYSQAILLLTYFEEPRSKQGEIIQSLAMGRSTYYRYLERAAETLGEKLVELLRPSLRLELPAARPLVGRETELAPSARRRWRGQNQPRRTVGCQLARRRLLVHLSQGADRSSGTTALCARLLFASTRHLWPLAASQHQSTGDWRQQSAGCVAPTSRRSQLIAPAALLR